MHALAVGQQFGTLSIQRRLGSGGMGEVYLAHDAALDRFVAVKTLAPGLARDSGLLERFQREARAAARLSHPNIVHVYSVDIHADPPYLVMEYIQGNTLDKTFSADEPLAWQRALSICGQVAAALACAHENGIIHRDIKPGNILIDTQSRVRVTDFGIAKVVGTSDTGLTAANTTIGSPRYMSPEQCGVGDVIPASDLFSLGITTFETISGKLPFDADTTIALIRKITSEPLPNLRDFAPHVPPIVQEFIEALTAKDPRERYASANQVLEDLNALQAGKPLPHLRSLKPHSTGAHGRPQSLVDELLGDSGPASRLPQRPASSAWPKVAAVAGVLLIAAVVVVYAVRGRTTSEPRAQSGAAQEAIRETPRDDIPPRLQQPEPALDGIHPPAPPRPGQRENRPPGMPLGPPPGAHAPGMNPYPPSGAHRPPPPGQGPSPPFPAPPGAPR